MILIELVYEEGCPHLSELRANLAWAFIEARVSPRCTEWDLASPLAPARVRSFPAPTLLVNGRDVRQGPPDASTAFLPVPSVHMIAAALRAAAAAGPDIPDHRGGPSRSTAKRAQSRAARRPGSRQRH